MCSGCENRVKTALSTLDFVEKVEADHKTGVVKVEFVENADVNGIYEAIEDLGFECVKEDQYEENNTKPSVRKCAAVAPRLR